MFGIMVVNLIVALKTIKILLKNKKINVNS